MRFRNLTILGTSHIAVQSISDVKKHVLSGDYGIVCIELDMPRLASLLSRKKPKLRLRDIRRVGLRGFIFALIGGWAERKLGEKTGIKPGAEMKLAYTLAKEKCLKIFLIDQDISVTLRKISSSLTWKEKWHFVVDVFKSLVLRKQEVVFDLASVPSEAVISRLTSKVKKRYPNLYRVLVTERNQVMASRLAQICAQNPETGVLAVMGAGHESEILSMVKSEMPRSQVTYSITVVD